VTTKYPHQRIDQPIAALLPRDESGFHFLLYGDCCSGVPGAPQESTFASVNSVAGRIWPPPEFICFLGDEISGLTADCEVLRAQWKHWLEYEMAWLDREAIPLYHVTSNHTIYDVASEQIFREVLSYLPGNGPKGQEGLSYFVRRNDLLLVFINTSTLALGGDGWVETEWIEKTLRENADAHYKFVVGHQPIYPVKGYAGPRMGEVMPDIGSCLWNLFVRNGVFAYLCGHMLCFDVQVHRGVLQLLTSGAGTSHLLPGEYHHVTQCAIDQDGFRCETVDSAGQIRERLSWPLRLKPDTQWQALSAGVTTAPSFPHTGSREEPYVILFGFAGVNSSAINGSAQTLLSAWRVDSRLAALWIGLCGIECEITVKISPVEGRSPQLWRGPRLAISEPFSFQLAIHIGMGPGGVLWRSHESAPWTSLVASSTWGAERLGTFAQWSVGHDRADATREPFRGRNLRVKWHSQLAQ
jgi:hypothetical protein